MSLVISNYPLRSLDKRPSSTFSREKRLFNSGRIILNGQNINVGGSMEITANKINEASSITGVEARTQISKVGIKLVLSTSDTEIRIIDPQKILLNLYKSNNISSENNSLIQIINNKNIGIKVSINYFTKVSSVVNFNALKEEFFRVGNTQHKNNRLRSGLNGNLNSFHNSNIIDDLEECILPTSSETPRQIASEAYNFARKTTISSYKIIRFNV